MSDELCGFWRKDAEKNTEFYRGVKCCPAHIIETSKLVPVRLVSESVSLRWLEAKLGEVKEDFENIVDNKDLYLEKMLNPVDVELFFDSIENLNIVIRDLLLAAKKQAEAGKK